MTTISPPRPSPFLTIWGEPRTTLRRILEIDPGYLVAPLAVASVAVPWMALCLMISAVWLTPPRSPVVPLLFGSVLGLLKLYVASWLLKAAGGWLRGRANEVEIRTVVAWSSVPNLVGTILWLPLIFLMGFGLVSFDSPGRVLSVLLIQNIVMGVVLRVWSIVILCKGLGEVQGFSAWKGLQNLVLSLVLSVPLLLMSAGAALMLCFRAVIFGV
jgi:Yip1-like protein